LIIPLR